MGHELILWDPSLLFPVGIMHINFRSLNVYWPWMLGLKSLDVVDKGMKSFKKISEFLIEVKQWCQLLMQSWLLNCVSTFCEYTLLFFMNEGVVRFPMLTLVSPKNKPANNKEII